MKAFSFSVLMFVLFVTGCTHSPDPAPSPTPPVAPPQTRRVMVVSDSVKIPPIHPEMQVKSENRNFEDYEDIEVKVSEAAKGELAAPCSPSTGPCITSTTNYISVCSNRSRRDTGG